MADFRIFTVCLINLTKKLESFISKRIDFGGEW